MKKTVFEEIFDLTEDEEIVYSTVSEEENPDAIVLVFDQSEFSTMVSIHPPTLSTYGESRKSLSKK